MCIGFFHAFGIDGQYLTCKAWKARAVAARGPGRWPAAVWRLPAGRGRRLVSPEGEAVWLKILADQKLLCYIMTCDSLKYNRMLSQVWSQFL